MTAPSGLPKGEWRLPFWLTVAAISAVVAFMIVFDMGPETTLVVAFGAFIGAAIWCVLSLSQPQWMPTAPPRAVVAPRAAGADQRVRALRTGILFGRALDGHSDRLYHTLVDVIDDQLLHAHGVNRSIDPEAAASIIGPNLASFVNDPESAGSIANTKELTRIVTLIEQI